MYKLIANTFMWLNANFVCLFTAFIHFFLMLVNILPTCYQHVGHESCPIGVLTNTAQAVISD